jgi:triphosphatase
VSPLLERATTTDPATSDAHPPRRRRPRGRCLTSTEVELKLAAPPPEFPKLKCVLLAMSHGRSEVQSELTSTYYDTPDLALYREGLTLRVRKQGRTFVQTVKAGDFAGADLVTRREWEDPIAGMRPDLDAPKTGKRIPEEIREEDLRPLFSSSVRRTIIEIEPQVSTQIEAAVDEGEIRTADRSGVEPVGEIELELESGDPAALFEVALRLLEAAPVRIETRSKAERGYRLLAPAHQPQAVYAVPVALDPAMAVEAALQRFGRTCLTHMLRNEPAMLAGEPEGVHQMRVAGRRLRSVLSTFKPMLPIEHYRWASEELKWVTHALGPVRNWDIFAASLLRPVSDGLPANLELEDLVRSVKRRRHAVVDEAKQAILSERYTKSMLLLFQWFEARRWRQEPVSERAIPLLTPIVDSAPELIEQCYRRARKRSKRFAAQNPKQRHRLRIALKKLRYIIGLLESLFDSIQVSTFVSRLKSLQDGLGHANDVRVSYDLVDELLEKTDHEISAIARAGGIVLGWHERGLADYEPKLRRHVRRLKHSSVFW